MRLTVAQALVRYLAVQHSDRDGRRELLFRGVWAIFGHGNVGGLGEALESYGQELDLPTYRPQNEQAMVHAAIAYAKHKNRLSTFACTSSIGPGATNMLTGAAAATINRIPVLLLPSDYFANRFPDPVLQQLEHPMEHDLSINDAFRPVSRFFARVHRPEALLSILPEAMRVLTDPVETGAVTIALPEDVQAEAYDFPEAFFAPRVWRVRRPPPEEEALAEAVALLKGAQRPLVIAGGGVIYSEASEALAELTQAYGLPVTETQAGKGAIPWDHPMNVGPIGPNGGLAANRLAREADLVLAVGTRLTDFTTASKTAFQNPKVRFIGLNVTPMDAYKLQALPLVADARRGLEALARALEGWAGTPAAYRGEVARLKAEWEALQEEYRRPKGGVPLSQAALIGLVNEAFPEATVINAAGSLPGDLLRLWRTRDPKGYHLEYGYSTMGYEIPAGIGVKLAEPGREVVVFIGDGSYLMMNSELVTARGLGLDLTVVLVDNLGFGSILGLQRALGSPSFGNELLDREGRPLKVDFAAHARALGAEARLVEDAEGLREALAWARATPGVKVLVVPVDREARLPSFEGWWDVPPAEVSRRPEVREARARYEAMRRRQRLLYGGEDA